jgi:ABC-type multidrug transport system fused ATPase/permease subunit
MIFVQPLAASLVGVIFLLCFLMYFFFLRKKMELWGHSRQYHDGLRIQHVQQGLGSIKEIKLFGRENGFASVFEVHNFGNADVLRKQYFMREVPRLAIESVAVTALAIVVVLISLGSESQTLIPTLALFAAAAFRVMPSLNRIIVMSSVVSFGKSVIDNLAKELLLEEENFKDGRTKQITFMNEIKINEVDFSYNETSQLVLKDINISISKGEMVGFIGGSGSGKTTLIDIILGLLNPTKGNILIDGIDIKKNIRNWQSSIGYVPQDIYLTDNTLKNNIAIGVDDNDICLDSIVQSYKDARLEEFIDSLEDGVNTIVGERGSRISGGQKQRIGIARALYNRPSILVLDESTSALDPETEKGILKTINALKGKMTILMITHRESTLSHCDRVFRVSDGKIKES